MKKIFNGILCFVLVIMLLPNTAFAAVVSADASEGDCITIIVEVKGDAVLESKNAVKLGYKDYLGTYEAKKAEKTVRTAQSEACAQIRGAVKEDTPVLFTYTHLFNGFAMKVNKNDIEKIQALPNVEKVYTGHKYKLFENTDGEAASEKEEQEGEAALNLGSEMMKLEYMHERGYTGKGLVIAVVDSAFDVNHIMFSEPVSNPRLSKSDIASLIKNNSLSVCDAGATISVNRVYRSEKIPYAFNYGNLSADTYLEVSDHGTHVAGIAAGNHGIDSFGNEFIGAAPDAQLLLMACTTGDDASGLDDAALLAGMEDAVKLGADIINCSFGGANNISSTPEIMAVNTARDAGILVSVAAGNESRGRGSQISADLIDYSNLPTPADISASTAVASADNMTYIKTFYCFEAGGEEVQFNSLNDKISFCDAMKGGEYEYVYAGKGLEEDFEGVDVNGKVAMMENGDIQFWRKAFNAQNAGAVAAMISYESIDAAMTQNELVKIPVAIIYTEDMERLKGAQDKRMTVLEGMRKTVEYNESVRMSSFSSWITERTLELKPEITAPGGNIYSSCNDDRFMFMSGTSMATPFFSGASALMLEYMAANPDKYGGQGNRITLLENMFMSTADVVIQKDDIPYSPRLQGAGLANAEKAAKTPVILLGDEFTTDDYTYRKSKISLREISLDESDTFTLSFTARNITNTPVTYDSLSMKVITDNADANGYITDMRELTFSAGLPESVTVPANGDAEITVPVTLDGDELNENSEVFTNGFYIDGYVFLGSSDENIPELNIPFTGFYGDWCAQPSLDGYIYDDNLLSETYLFTETNRLSNGDYGSSYENLILGYNLFDKYNSGLRGKEYVGISPNYDGEADDLCIRYMPLRITGVTDFFITDDCGNEISERAVDSNGNNFMAMKLTSAEIVFGKEALNKLPDGDYVFKIKTGFLYREPYEQNETVEMPFYIDREAPVINSFFVGEDGDEISLSVSDNRYLMGIVVSGMSDGTYKYVSYPTAPQKSFSTVIDISDFEEDSVTVEVLDYAYNSTKVSNSPPKFEYKGRQGSEFMFEAYNDSGKDIPCTLVFGLYWKDRLVGLTYKKDEIIRNGTSHKYFNLDCGVYDKIKLLVWENITGMKPICESFEF